jgi:hypothetical protein
MVEALINGIKGEKFHARNRVSASRDEGQLRRSLDGWWPRVLRNRPSILGRFSCV